MPTRTPTPLREALYQFSLAKPIPDAELLDDFIRRYPHYAGELTEFAIELAIDAAHGTDVEEDAVETAVSPAVSRVMSRFQNHLFAMRKAEPAAIASSEERALSAAPPNPFSSLDNASFRSAAKRLGVNTVFLMKLRDRQISPDTMKNGFREHVAKELSVPLEILASHFASPPGVGTSHQLYKSEEKPRAGEQQSFEDAVQGSGLTMEQQERLLKM